MESCEDIKRWEFWVTKFHDVNLISNLVQSLVTQQWEQHEIQNYFLFFTYIVELIKYSIVKTLMVVDIFLDIVKELKVSIQ